MVGEVPPKRIVGVLKIIGVNHNGERLVEVLNVRRGRSYYRKEEVHKYKLFSEITREKQPLTMS